MDTETWRRELLEEREEKDEFFAQHRQSPLPGAARLEFDGLEYFEPNPDLRFELPLREHEDKAPLTVATTDGDEREYLRWGEFAFEVDGTEQTLQAYKAEADESNLWVPFRDETNGDETYGGGRYIDLERETHRVSDRSSGGRPQDPEDRAGDRWVLDFNRAYNPFCVYSEQYECTMVPGENWLEVPIEAGEKLPDLDVAEGH